ncbi:MAG: minor extracellular protease Epr [Pseudomonadales bacterium]|jgi:minor extracellular protease Epr|uniref:S8 family serine peptidase n=1 Tax=Marinobacter maritimus TaxID=277961 RepID=UPI0011A4EFD9|nr:S8 family serine peptidase [Marinobacter maritimus]
MIPRLNIRLLIFLTFPVLPAQALGAGPSNLLDGRIEAITNQVERRAERLVERKITEDTNRRIAEASEVPTGLEASLPEMLPIKTRDGVTAFFDARQSDGTRAVARQWLLTASEEELSQLRHPDITILQRQQLNGLGLTVVRFRVSPERDSHAALRELLPELADQLDRNHIYTPQSTPHQAEPQAVSPSVRSLCTEPVRVGMVDTVVNNEHPAFSKARIVQQRFLAVGNHTGDLAEPQAHGTAVASVLVGRPSTQAEARLPGASLFSASVFYKRSDVASGATLAHLLEGLNWLTEQKVAVINISLTGPDNRILASVIRRLHQQGVTLVAAVGNEGPAAPPLYPAAYDGVIGVTAVDNNRALYRWANRGQQVAFAARGVDITVAHPDGSQVTKSGTSLASPVVAALLACRLLRLSPEQALRALINDAEDLGEKGHDPSFGHGFLDDRSERLKTPPEA